MSYRQLQSIWINYNWVILKSSNLFWHIGQSFIARVVSNRDVVGCFLVGFIEAGEGLASICGFVICCSNLSGEERNFIIHLN